MPTQDIIRRLLPPLTVLFPIICSIQVGTLMAAPFLMIMVLWAVVQSVIPPPHSEKVNRSSTIYKNTMKAAQKPWAVFLLVSLFSSGDPTIFCVFARSLR